MTHNIIQTHTFRFCRKCSNKQQNVRRTVPCPIIQNTEKRDKVRPFVIAHTMYVARIFFRILPKFKSLSTTVEESPRFSKRATNGASTRHVLITFQFYFNLYLARVISLCPAASAFDARPRRNQISFLR